MGTEEASPRPRGVDALGADIARRIELLREELRRRRLDALLVTREVNVHYLSGFEGTESALLVGLRRKVLLTDFRFVEQARLETRGFRVVRRTRPLIEEAVAQARAMGLRRLAYESGGMTAADRDDLLRASRRGPRRVELEGVRSVVEALRAVKSPAEVEAIRRAVRLAEEAFGAARALLGPGVAELAVARAVERDMEDRGASASSFEVIAALDARASLPHARPSPLVRATRRSVLLLDWGARWRRYCSDLTRTLAVSSIPAWLRRAHEAVLEAQARAIERIGPGVRARDVDAAAREVLRKAGFGREFGHGVGHGLGLEVHEAPGLGPRSEDVLREGMVVTVEPGVYIPGRGGVRVEDDVLVGSNGAEVLSSLPRGMR